MYRVLQSLDGRFSVFHLNFRIRYYAVKFLLRNPACSLLIRQVVRYVVIEPVGIRDNDINHPLQIVEEAGQVLPAPCIIWLCIRTLGAIRDDKTGPFPVRNTN